MDSVQVRLITRSKFPRYMVKSLRIPGQKFLDSVVKISHSPHPDTFHTVIFHLRHIGSNLNQIARVANTSGKIDTQGYKENVKNLNKEILEIRKRIIQ